MEAPTHFALSSTQPAKKKAKSAPPIKREKRDNSAHGKRLAKFAGLQACMVPPHSEAEANLRHSCWRERRDRVRRALIETGINDFALNRFDSCGSECSVEYSRTLDKIRLRANYCHSKHCEPCMRAKANRIAANLRGALATKKHGDIRFITLTLKHSDTPLAAQIARLYSSWKTMRGYRPWKKTQTGGCAMLEVKWDPRSRHWHPHLHVIAEGRFLDKTQLSAMWQKATTDSMIVDIRRIDQAKDAVHYVTKYITKGTSPAVWNDASARQEWIMATKGVRTCATYGKWRGLALTKLSTTAEDWRPIARYDTVLEAARRGDEWAKAILAQIAGVYEQRDKPRPPKIPPD